jgi:hypothetical protein
MGARHGWPLLSLVDVHPRRSSPLPRAGEDSGDRGCQSYDVTTSGGRIVAEVFLRLMFGDPDSLLSHDPQWQPPSGPSFALKDFVNYALGK